MDAVLERGAVMDQVQPEAGPLALGADARIGQPDGRHQLAPRQLGQDPGIDAVGLGHQWRQALGALRVGDVDLPAEALEAVVHEARARHRLDCRAHRLRTLASHARGQRAQRIGVGADPGLEQPGAVLVEDADVESAA